MEQLSKSWSEEFKAQSLYRMDESVRMLGICLERLPADRFWVRPNPASNSVGNLLQHLSGNIRQYVVSGLGRLPDSRKRDSEFEDTSATPDQVWRAFSETVSKAQQVIGAATASELLEVRSVQGFRMSGMGMVLHAVEHLSYHTGQIAYALKAWLDTDLGFYDGVDLNAKNT